MTNNEALITHTVFFFPNGNTAVCRGAAQVPDLQQSWLLLFVRFLEEKGIDPMGCELNLPTGLIAKVFKCSDGSYSWRIVLGP